MISHDTYIYYIIILLSADPSKGEGAREAGILRIWGVQYPPTPPRGRAPKKQGYCEFGGFPVSQVWEPLGALSLSSLFFPILMHSFGDVWHPGPGVPCFGGFAGFAAFGGSQSHFLPYSSLS